MCAHAGLRPHLRQPTPRSHIGWLLGGPVCITHAPSLSEPPCFARAGHALPGSVVGSRALGLCPSTPTTPSCLSRARPNVLVLWEGVRLLGAAWLPWLLRAGRRLCHRLPPRALGLLCHLRLSGAAALSPLPRSCVACQRHDGGSRSRSVRWRVQRRPRGGLAQVLHPKRTGEGGPGECVHVLFFHKRASIARRPPS